MIGQLDIEKAILDTVKLDKYVQEVADHLKKTTFLTINYRDIDKWVAGFFLGIENTLEVLLVRAFVVSQFKAIDPERKFKELPEEKEFLKTTRTEEALKYVKQKGAYSIQQATDATKMKTKEIVYRGLNEGLGWRDIANMLREEIKEDGELQRYWQRVAISETTTALNNGYLASKDIGTYVIGQGYDDACVYCKDLIIGKVYKIGTRPETNYADLDPTSKEYKELTKYYDNYVWVGKDNVGRSGAKQKKNGDGTTTLRLPHELYTPAIGQHPMCRCSWVGFDPDLLYANKNGNFIPKYKDPEQWKEWNKKNIKERY